MRHTGCPDVGSPYRNDERGVRSSMSEFNNYVRSETIFSTIATLLVTASIYGLVFGFSHPAPVRGVGA